MNKTSKPGITVKEDTPFGSIFVTVNRDEQNNPAEVFVTVAKCGSDLQADAEGLGRLLSLSLRKSANPIETMRESVIQLRGIGGGRQEYHTDNGFRSVPDSIARALEHYLEICDAV